MSRQRFAVADPGEIPHRGRHLKAPDVRANDAPADPPSFTRSPAIFGLGTAWFPVFLACGAVQFDRRQPVPPGLGHKIRPCAVVFPPAQLPSPARHLSQLFLLWPGPSLARPKDPLSSWYTPPFLPNPKKGKIVEDFFGGEGTKKTCGLGGTGAGGKGEVQRQWRGGGTGYCQGWYEASAAAYGVRDPARACHRPRLPAGRSAPGSPP